MIPHYLKLVWVSVVRYPDYKDFSSSDGGTFCTKVLRTKDTEMRLLRTHCPIQDQRLNLHVTEHKCSNMWKFKPQCRRNVPFARPCPKQVLYMLFAKKLAKIQSSLSSKPLLCKDSEILHGQAPPRAFWFPAWEVHCLCAHGLSQLGPLRVGTPTAQNFQVPRTTRQRLCSENLRPPKAGCVQL